MIQDQLPELHNHFVAEGLVYIFKYFFLFLILVNYINRILEIFYYGINVLNT